MVMENHILMNLKKYMNMLKLQIASPILHEYPWFNQKYLDRSSFFFLTKKLSLQGFSKIMLRFLLILAVKYITLCTFLLLQYIFLCMHFALCIWYVYIYFSNLPHGSKCSLNVQLMQVYKLHFSMVGYFSILSYFINYISNKLNSVCNVYTNFENKLTL